MSATEVAEIADVGPSAVSNWRKRHSDFPVALEDSAGGSVTFQYGEIVSWLKKHGKEIQTPEWKTVNAFWECANTTRGSLRPDGLLELLLQLMLLRRAQTTQGDRGAESHLWGAWKELLDGEVSPEEVLGAAAQAVRGDDPDLARAIRPQHGLAELDPEQFRSVCRVVDEAFDEETDWGRVSTETLREFNERLGSRAEFSTPAGLEYLMTGLLRPIEGSVLDPACGAAMFLARAWADRESDEVRLFGQEVAESAWRLGYLHLRLRDAEFELASGDTLRDDRFWSLKADRIVMDPPLKQRLSSDELLGDDPRWVLGPPTPSTSDYAWIQHLIYHLGEGGIGVTTTVARNLFQGGRVELMRAELLRTDLLDAVVQLPPGLSHGSSLAMVLLLFQRGRSGRHGRVLFIDGRQLGTPRKGGTRHLATSDIDRVLETVRSWRLGQFDPEAQFSAAATYDDIANQGWQLTPQRYVRYAVADTEIQGEPIAERWDRLSRELARQLDELPAALSAAHEVVSRVRKADERE